METWKVADLAVQAVCRVEDSDEDVIKVNVSFLGIKECCTAGLQSRTSRIFRGVSLHYVEQDSRKTAPLLLR